MKKAIIFDWGSTLCDRRTDKLFDGVKCVLERLSGKYVLAIAALATDGDIEKRLEVIKREGIDKYFAYILFSKSNKEELYKILLQKLGLSPEELVVVDDRVIRGIRWGNMNGATTVWVRQGKFCGELPDEKTGEPTHTVGTIKQILTFL